MENNNSNKGSDKKELTTEQIQAAKDFIWEHLEPHVKPFLLKMACTSLEDRKSMYVPVIFVRAEAKAPFGVIEEEKLIIGFSPTNPQ